MKRNVEIHSDVRLVDPTPDRLAAAVSKAVTVANAISMNGQLDRPSLGVPEIVGEGSVQAVADLEESCGVEASSCHVGAVAVAGVAWWTSRTGKVHVRVCGGVGLRGNYQPVWMPTGVLYDLGAIRLFDDPTASHNVDPGRARRLALEKFGRKWEASVATAPGSRRSQNDAKKSDFRTLVHENPCLEKPN